MHRTCLIALALAVALACVPATAARRFLLQEEEEGEPDVIIIGAGMAGKRMPALQSGRTGPAPPAPAATLAASPRLLVRLPLPRPLNLQASQRHALCRMLG